jgi:hypothetical protein
LLGLCLGPRRPDAKDPQLPQSGNALRAQPAARTEDARPRRTGQWSDREEIREVFMQVAIYCGVPAGVDAFRNAKEVFAELDRK